MGPDLPPVTNPKSKILIRRVFRVISFSCFDPLLPLPKILMRKDLKGFSEIYRSTFIRLHVRTRVYKRTHARVELWMRITAEFDYSRGSKRMKIFVYFVRRQLREVVNKYGNNNKESQVL